MWGWNQAANELEGQRSSVNVALLRLAYDLALRIGELARLDVADVDLKTGGLWIFGKGRRAKELVTMPQTSREAVKAWLQERRSKPGPLLLSLSPADWHGRLVTRGVYRIIRDLGAAAGVHVRPHGIRHTAITTAIDAAAKHGHSIDLDRQFSRHRSLNTLMVYRDLHESERTQALFATLVSERLNARPNHARTLNGGESMTHAVDLLPGTSLWVLLVNSLLLMRAGLSKHQAMAAALNVAGYRPRATGHSRPKGA